MKKAKRAPEVSLRDMSGARHDRRESQMLIMHESNVRPCDFSNVGQHGISREVVNEFIRSGMGSAKITYPGMTPEKLAKILQMYVRNHKDVPVLVRRRGSDVFIMRTDHDL